MIFSIALGKESEINFITLIIYATSFTILLSGCFVWNNFYSSLFFKMDHITSHTIPKDD